MYDDLDWARGFFLIIFIGATLGFLWATTFKLSEEEDYQKFVQVVHQEKPSLVCDEKYFLPSGQYRIVTDDQGKDFVIYNDLTIPLDHCRKASSDDEDLTKNSQTAPD